MALKATIFKASLNIADMDRHHYHDYHLTLARHPSETDERMMIRLVAFALNANEQLQFTKGLSADDEPELWEKSLSEEIVHWIDLGLPDEKRIRKACGKAKKVSIYCYGGNPAQQWYNKNANALQRYKNLNVIALDYTQTQALTALTHRTMQLQCSIQDQELWISDGDNNLLISPTVLLQQSK